MVIEFLHTYDSIDLFTFTFSTSDDFRGMLFGMTQRNADTASALWGLWDNFAIQESTLNGWWEDDAPIIARNVTCNGAPTTTGQVDLVTFLIYSCFIFDRFYRCSDVGYY